MVNEPHKLILLPNRSYQATVRSEIKKIANAIGFSAKKMAEFEIIVAEITSNIIKHTASGGELLVKALAGEDEGIEIISIDAGPGMEAVNRMMEDGVSTTNTLGQGLGAIKRLSDEFDIYSQKGWGTVLLCRLYKQKKEPKKRPFEIGVVMLAKPGETVCGDNYYYAIKGNNLRIALSDGLGHGSEANIAANKTLQVFREHLATTPEQQIRIIHGESRKTRGAVMAAMHLDLTNRQLMHCGVGNIASRILSLNKAKSLVSYNGIVGHSIPNSINNHIVQWSKNDVLIIHSDGLVSRWDIQKYPGILKNSPALVAAVLFKDFCRKNDDVTIIVIR